MLSADSTLNSSAPSPNPYRDLVDKYEALLEVHNEAFRNRQDDTTPVSSVHEELASSNFEDNEPSEPSQQPNKEDVIPTTKEAAGAKRKLNLRTPTDFSEAETSSSGYSDGISNKFTQTEETFLCTIADGDDKFSIYDETSPIDSRFRHCPKLVNSKKNILNQFINIKLVSPSLSQVSSSFQGDICYFEKSC